MVVLRIVRLWIDREWVLMVRSVAIFGLFQERRGFQQWWLLVDLFASTFSLWNFFGLNFVGPLSHSLYTFFCSPKLSPLVVLLTLIYKGEVECFSSCGRTGLKVLHVEKIIGSVL